VGIEGVTIVTIVTIAAGYKNRRRVQKRPENGHKNGHSGPWQNYGFCKMLIGARLQARQAKKRHRCSLVKPLENLKKNALWPFF